MGVQGAIEIAEAIGTTYAVGKTVTAGHGGMLAAAFGNRPPPGAPKPPMMASANTIFQGQQLAAAKAAALRQGRASTILTNNADTGDRLGP